MDDTVSTNGSIANTEISKEEVLKHIFGEIGELIDDFSCAVESKVLLHGRMYITNKFICFYSNLFGLEKKIRIPYTHIKSITKEKTAIVIPNAIAISTDKKEYVFRSFWDRDECHKLLIGFLAKFRRGSEAENYKPKVFVESVLNNISVDSSNGTNNATDTGQQGVIKDYFINNDSPTVTNSITTNPNPTTSTPITPSNAPAISLPNSNITITNKPGDRNSVRRSTRFFPITSQSSTGSQASISVANPAAANMDSIEEEAVYDTESCLDTARGPDADENADNISKFEAEVAANKPKIFVASDSIPISLKEFMALFIWDAAPFGFQRYHESVKDTNIVMTPWTEMQTLGYGREMKFFKPVNLPGLASTRGVKVQRFRKFSDVGAIVCSSTRLEDVPAADTFSVDDVIVVRTMDGGLSIKVDIMFEVKFIKSTYFKYVIESSTNGEMKKWLETYFGHLKKIATEYKSGLIQLDLDSFIETRRASSTTTEPPLNLPVVKPSANPELIQNPIESDIPTSTKQLYSRLFTFHWNTMEEKLNILCIVLVISFLFWNCMEWRSINTKLSELEKTLERIQSNMENVK